MPPKETKSSQNRAASSKHKQWYRNTRFERSVPFCFMGLSKQRYKSSLLNQKGTLCACEPLCLPIRFLECCVFPYKAKMWYDGLRKAEKRRKKYWTDQSINQELLKYVCEVFHLNFKIIFSQFCWATSLILCLFKVCISFYSILYLPQRMLTDFSKGKIK